MNVLQKLRAACKKREPFWNPQGKELTSLYRSNELAGEVGELANAVKKLNRHEMGMAGGVSDKTNLKEEIGDVIISCILLADHYDVDVWDAVVDKFNKTSEKHGFPIGIDADGNITDWRVDVQFVEPKYQRIFTNRGGKAVITDGKGKVIGEQG